MGTWRAPAHDIASSLVLLSSLKQHGGAVRTHETRITVRGPPRCGLAASSQSLFARRRAPKSSQLPQGGAMWSHGAMEPSGATLAAWHNPGTSLGSQRKSYQPQLPLGVRPPASHAHTRGCGATGLLLYPAAHSGEQRADRIEGVSGRRTDGPRSVAPARGTSSLPLLRSLFPTMFAAGSSGRASGPMRTLNRAVAAHINALGRLTPWSCITPIHHGCTHLPRPIIDRAGRASRK